MGPAGWAVRGGARRASGVWGRVQSTRCPKSRGLSPPRSPAQKAAAVGGRARLPRWRGRFWERVGCEVGGGSRGARWATGRMDLGLWLISAWGAALCSRRLFGGLAEGGTGVGAGRAAVQPGRYFLKMSCSGPGRYLMTVSRMLSSSSSAASPQPGGMAFLGLVRLPSELALLKLVCLEPVLHNKRSHCNEKPTHLD